MMAVYHLVMYVIMRVLWVRLRRGNFGFDRVGDKEGNKGEC